MLLVAGLRAQTDLGWTTTVALTRTEAGAARQYRAALQQVIDQRSEAIAACEQRLVRAMRQWELDLALEYPDDEAGGSDVAARSKARLLALRRELDALYLLHDMAWLALEQYDARLAELEDARELIGIDIDAQPPATGGFR